MSSRPARIGLCPSNHRGNHRRSPSYSACTLPIRLAYPCVGIAYIWWRRRDHLSLSIGDDTTYNRSGHYTDSEVTNDTATVTRPIIIPIRVKWRGKKAPANPDPYYTGTIYSYTWPVHYSPADTLREAGCGVHCSHSREDYCCRGYGTRGTKKR